MGTGVRAYDEGMGGDVGEETMEEEGEEGGDGLSTDCEGRGRCGKQGEPGGDSLNAFTTLGVRRWLMALPAL